MKISRINDYEYLNFLIRADVFESFKDTVLNDTYIGFWKDDEIFAVMSLKRLTNLSSEFFFTCMPGTITYAVKIFRDNEDAMWELMECSKLTTFIREDNKKSLHVSNIFNFKKVGFMKDYESDENGTYGMYIKELERLK